MNIKSNKKYLFLIPLVVSLIMLTFFAVAYNEIVREKHEQVFHGLQMALDLVASQIDRFVEEDEDWGEYDYISLIRPTIVELDSMPMVYAALFDSNLVLQSDRIIDQENQESFDPLAYDEFMLAIEKNESGELAVTVSDGIHPSYEGHLYFRKIPSGPYNDKILTVIGAGKYAILDNFAPWLVWGVVGLVSMTVLLEICMVLYIARLSDTERRIRVRMEQR